MSKVVRFYNGQPTDDLLRGSDAPRKQRHPIAALHLTDVVVVVPVSSVDVKHRLFCLLRGIYTPRRRPSLITRKSRPCVAYLGVRVDRFSSALIGWCSES